MWTSRSFIAFFFNLKRVYLKLHFFLALLYSCIYESKIYPKIVFIQITYIFVKNKSNF